MGNLKLTPPAGPVLAVAEGVTPTPFTIAMNAIHFAYHQGYLTLEEARDAHGHFSERLTLETFAMFNARWAQRHGLEPRGR
ncbi:MAG: hypothetical protein Q4C67_06595 [Deinococcus sp.]|nr:hypothetical protein [Deinococcus sp.]